MKVQDIKEIKCAYYVDREILDLAQPMIRHATLVLFKNNNIKMEMDLIS